MLTAISLFLLIFAGVLALKVDGATRSPMHLAARALALTSALIGIGQLLQAPDGATTLVTGLMVVLAAALLIRLQSQVGQDF